MPVRPAPSLTLVVLTLIAGGCAKLHHQQALTWRLVVELDHSVPDIQTATAQRFSSWTQNNINQYVGVVLNDEIKSTAFIKSQLSDSAAISGNFTKASAEDLAQILMSGPFPAPIRIVEEPKD